MANITQVTLAAGIPTVGTGTVSTIDALMADGGQATLGAQADAASATTTIKAALRGIATALGITAIDLGSGTGGTRTLRTILDTASPGIITTGSQAVPSPQYLSSIVAGDVAAAASDTGNPTKIGGVGHTANPTAVTDGQRVNAIFDKLGKQVVVGAIRDLKGVLETSISNTTGETTILAAVASTFLDVYGLILANTGVSNTKVTIRDDTAGTTRGIFMVPAGETRGFMLPVDSAIPQAVVNKPWTAQCGTATTALEVTILYVKNI